MERFNKMKRVLLSILAIFFPWIVILLEGRFIASMACLALQLTVIGWIPASIWAFRAVKNIHLPENNAIDTTQSPEKTQEENVSYQAETAEIVENSPSKDSNLVQEPKDKE
jgi:uncharacterized membrane protein YqaE (UPF0057 family)